MDIMRLIPRNSYMEKIINVIGTPDIKVITGVRRCGKSKLLESLKKYIDENIQDANIIHINFNLPEFEELLTFRALYEHINSLYKENMQNFVLIDEVQMLFCLVQILPHFLLEFKCKLFLIGNAWQLVTI